MGEQPTQPEAKSTRTPPKSCQAGPWVLLYPSFPVLMNTDEIWVHASPGDPRLPAGRGEGDVLSGAEEQLGAGTEPANSHVASSTCHKASVASYPAQSLSNSTACWVRTCP